MNHPMRLLLIAGLLLFGSTGFTTVHPTPPPKPCTIYYYWFTYPDDAYNDYASLDQEETEWWIYYDGVVINTNPIGGTLIARGYPDDVYPHDKFPTVFLYAHFTH
jgi:hypothetical protein